LVVDHNSTPPEKKGRRMKIDRKTIIIHPSAFIIKKYGSSVLSVEIYSN
jgi:hypothetical protein